VESFEATFGRVPDNFRLLAEHAPAAFAGYGLIRDALMRERADGGALDLKTKELIFTLLDTLSRPDDRSEKPRCCCHAPRPHSPGTLGRARAGRYGGRDHDLEQDRSGRPASLRRDRG
jgi:hypothetical protein